MKKFFNIFRKNKNKPEIFVSGYEKEKNYKKLTPSISLKRSRMFFLIFILICVSAAFGALIGKLLDVYIFNPDNYGTRTVHIEGDKCSAGEAVSLKATKSVVGIRCVIFDDEKNTNRNKIFSFGGFSGLPFFGDLDVDDSDDETDEESKIVQIESGSGVIYKIKDDRVYILTNCHVVKDSMKYSDRSRIEIHFGREIDKYVNAKVVRANPLIDIAVLEIPLKDNKGVCAEIGDSSKLNTGQEVYHIGSPNNISYNGSITHGIVSALDKSVKFEGNKNKVKVFQTDVAMNPGGSGGGLFDSKGRLVGICVGKMSSRISKNGSADVREGIGFCLPINDVCSAAEKIIEGKDSDSVEKIANLGIIMESEDSLFGTNLGGVVVKDVFDGSAAQKAGIRPGDIIMRFDGEEIKDSNDLDSALSRKKGNIAEIGIGRIGKMKGGRGLKLKRITLKVNFD